jgi:hypothetical protein
MFRIIVANYHVKQTCSHLSYTVLYTKLVQYVYKINEAVNLKVAEKNNYIDITKVRNTFTLYSTYM